MTFRLFEALSSQLQICVHVHYVSVLYSVHLRVFSAFSRDSWTLDSQTLGASGIWMEDSLCFTCFCLVSSANRRLLDICSRH